VVSKQAAFLQTASSVVLKVSYRMLYNYRVICPKSSATQKLQSLPHHANCVGGHRLILHTAEAGWRSSGLRRAPLGIGSFHVPDNGLRKQNEYITEILSYVGLL